MKKFISLLTAIFIGAIFTQAQKTEKDSSATSYYLEVNSNDKKNLEVLAGGISIYSTLDEIKDYLSNTINHTAHPDWLIKSSVNIEDYAIHWDIVVNKWISIEELAQVTADLCNTPDFNTIRINASIYDIPFFIHLQSFSAPGTTFEYTLYYDENDSLKITDLYNSKVIWTPGFYTPYLDSEMRVNRLCYELKSLIKYPQNQFEDQRFGETLLEISSGTNGEWDIEIISEEDDFSNEVVRAFEQLDQRPLGVINGVPVNTSTQISVKFLCDQTRFLNELIETVQKTLDKKLTKGYPKVTVTNDANFIYCKAKFKGKNKHRFSEKVQKIIYTLNEDLREHAYQNDVKLWLTLNEEEDFLLDWMPVTEVIIITDLDIDEEAPDYEDWDNVYKEYNEANNSLVTKRPTVPGTNEDIEEAINNKVKETAYPANALKRGIDGPVTMEFLVTSNGNIKMIQPFIMVYDYDLEKCFYDIIKSLSRLNPAESNGERVPYIHRQTIQFKLQ